MALGVNLEGDDGLNGEGEPTLIVSGKRPISLNVPLVNVAGFMNTTCMPRLDQALR
jgi:hypothetical protein